MEPVNEYITVAKVEDTNIMVHYQRGESWDVYYSKPHYPFMFAFGLPTDYCLGEVLDIASRNINNYSDLFDE